MAARDAITTPRAGPRGRRGGGASGAAGMVTMTVVPKPSREVATASPPKRSAMCLTIDRPSPVPPSRFEREGSAR